VSKHLCPYCGNETGGAEVCPWCNGSMGVVPKHGPLEPVIIHDRPKADWTHPSLVALVLILLAAFFGYRYFEQRNAQTVTQVSYRDRPMYLPSISNAIQRPKIDLQPHMTLAGGTTTPSADKPQDEQTEEDDDMVDDGLEDPVVTPSIQPAAVVIGGAALDSQDDGDGHGIAYGHVQISNPSSYPITSLTIMMSTSDGSYALVPVSGTLETATPLPSIDIPAGGTMDLPVMTNGMFSAVDPTSPKTITVQATENGTVVSSSTTVQ